MSRDLTPRPRSDATAIATSSPIHADAPGGTAPSDATVISTTPPVALRPSAQAAPPSELALSLLGQQIGDIRLEEFVGGGGMGIVFRGHDLKLHRTVAVKVLGPRTADDVDSHRRFQTEARSAARLDHPNIARVHFVGEEGGIRFLVFEYIEGTNLRDLVNASGPLPLADALRYTLQVADALMHAWQRDVVHRDIKPSNILINQEGQAKLVDMGLARLESADHADHDLTATGVTLGTFDYISPEQARDARSADIRSDIYSLGCTLFFLLVGKPPFADGTGLQKLLQHQAEEPPNLQQLRPDVPESVVEVVDTMLAKRPDDRFQNPAELLAALISVTEQLGMAFPQISLPVSWPAVLTQISWWRRHVFWLIPAALLLLTVLALELIWSRQQSTPDFPPLQLPAATGETPAGELPAKSYQEARTPENNSSTAPPPAAAPARGDRATTDQP
jgi:serine/threonine-protein kinase